MVRGRFLLLVVALSVGCGGTSVRQGTGGAGGTPPSVSDGGAPPQAGDGGSTVTSGVGGTTAATGGSAPGNGATSGVGGAGTGGTAAMGGAAAGPPATGGTAAGGTAAGGSTAGSAATGGQGEAPGCPPDQVGRCSPGSGAICTSQECVDAGASAPGIIERGDGVICKFSPDAVGPDFACIEGEWCQFELHECRCGKRLGCQLGERCAPCAGADCGTGEYDCVREVPCTEDNLDACTAEPGQICKAGALECSGPGLCPNGDGVGATLCSGAPSGCCATGEWCFDGRECRCGVDPSCADGEACVLNSVGLYRCGGRIR